MSDADPYTEFLIAACAPLDASHASGTLARANAILAEHPAVATADIHTAAVLGDAETVRHLLVRDPASATAKGGAHGWDALTHLCFSRYLRLDHERSTGFVDAATALLDAGADANTGFHGPSHQPEPAWESALYGAAGVAHHADVARLLIERGADVNDGEVAYHTPETWGNNAALQVVVGSGRLTPESLALMMLRKLDWTDFDAVEWLLQRGADPNLVNRWGPALQHAIGRDNAMRAFEILLAHGADPRVPNEKGVDTFAMAAGMGRADVLDLFARHGFTASLTGDAAFLEACARGDEAGARAIVAREPGIVARLEATRPMLLAHFAGAGNTAGVRLMLDLGFDVARHGDEEQTNGPTALHVAVWHERLETVRLLIERGAPIEATAQRGITPLAIAVRSLVDVSEWTPHASTAIVEALLAAGARVETVRPFPSGSPEADALLQHYGRVA